LRYVQARESGLVKRSSVTSRNYFSVINCYYGIIYPDFLIIITIT